MKNFKLLSGILMTCLLASCGGNKQSGDEIPQEPQEKDITCESNEFEEGGLAAYLKIESSDAPLKFYLKNETPYLQMKLSVELIKECPEVQNVNASEISFGSIAWRGKVNIVLLDENETKVTTLAVQEDDLLKVKKLLQGKVGDKTDLIFLSSGSSWNPENTYNEYNSAVSFKGGETVGFGTDTFSTYPESTASSSSENVEEFVVVDTDDDEDDDNNVSFSSSTSDEDFDEFLEAYENYIDKYIALLKKAQDGDYSAMADAASLMSDAQEYGEKLQKMKGNLTAAQLAKFQKLQQKLLNAAARQ